MTAQIPPPPLVPDYNRNDRSNEKSPIHHHSCVILLIIYYGKRTSIIESHICREPAKLSQSERGVDECDPVIVLTSSGETNRSSNPGLLNSPKARVADGDGPHAPKARRVARVSLLSNPSLPPVPSSSFESERRTFWRHRNAPLIPLSSRRGPFTLARAECLRILSSTAVRLFPCRDTFRCVRSSLKALSRPILL